MSVDDDEKPTVVLDLNALKKEKLKQEEDLANIAQELEFAVGPEEKGKSPSPKKAKAEVVPEVVADDSEDFAEQFLSHRAESEPKADKSYKVVLFDFQSEFFRKNKDKFPKGPSYEVATNLNELNKFLASKEFQIVVFNYDVNPKAVNQLTAQIKKKFPISKTMIMAKNISPEKAKIHAKTPSGAHGYYQFPIDAKKIESEFARIQNKEKKSAS